MSRISTTLQRLAAAQRVGMESAGEAVQGSTDELNQEELAAVASKAADTVKPEDGEETATETTDGADAPAGDEVVPAADGDATAAEEVPVVDAVAEEAPAGEEAADEVPLEEIQTPAEQELAEQAPEAAQDAATVDAIEEGATAVTDEASAPSNVSEAAAALDEVAGDGEAAEAASTATDTVAETAEVPTEAAVPEAGTVEAAPAETTEAPAAAEQAPAAAPGPATDTSETVQEVVELTEALAQATSAEEVVKQAHDASDGLKEVAETVEVINENGGASMESLAMIQLALRPFTHLIQRADLRVGVALESYADQEPGARQQVSMEEIYDLIQELDQLGAPLERQAVESLDRVAVALKDALPTALDRLRAVISVASKTNDAGDGATVDVSGGLAAALSFDGTIPEDLAGALQGYALLGKCLIGPFAEASIHSAKGSSLLNNAIDFSSTAAFWEKLGAVVETIKDPRDNLTRTQMESTLPGGAYLFGEPSPEIETANTTLQQLFTFNTCYAPLEAMVAAKGGEGATTYPAFAASKIVLVGNALQDVLCCDAINDRLCQAQKLWPEAQDVVRHLKENLKGAPTQIDHEAGADFSQVVKFVEVNYALATWPLLNYLTNLVLTINAFVMFAERSLAAKSSDAPAEEPVVEAAAAVDEAVVDEAVPAVDAGEAEELPEISDAEPALESFASGAVWSFFFGPFATAVLGHKKQEYQNKVAALQKKIAAKKDELRKKEGILLAAVNGALAEQAKGKVSTEALQVSQEGFTGAAVGFVLGLVAEIIPVIGPAILGGLWGEKIDEAKKSAEEATRELRELESELNKVQVQIAKEIAANSKK